MLIISFVTLYSTILWLSFLYLNRGNEQKLTKNRPYVSIAIPAHNEEKCIAKTMRSVAALEYPKNKLEIIVINDASTDKTKEIAERAKRELNNPNIKIINRKISTGTKAPGMNEALKEARGQYFGCVDADSVVRADALKKMLHHFRNPNVGAVISAIQVNDPKNVYEKVQRLEYILGILTRKLMSTIDSLVMTPGVLSLYRTDLLKKVGGFDDKNITEDFEIALRLKEAGYLTELEVGAHTYTNVPNDFRSLWRQRIRWFRGFVANNLKYRKMLFNKRYTSFGLFQMPFNILSVFVLILSVSIILWGTLSQLYEFILRSIMIKGYFWSSITSFTSPKDFLLGTDYNIMVPIYLASILGILMLLYAHKQIEQKIKYPVALWTYFVIFPYITALHWLSAIGQEFLKLKKKW